MAEYVEPQEPGKPGPDFKYPWEDWLDGNSRILRQEIDFPDTTPENLEKLIRKRARQLGVAVSVYHRHGNRLYVCARELS